MRYAIPALALLIGATGCGTVVSESGLCAGLRAQVEALASALLAHPDTPDPVGEAGADTVTGFDAGCP